MKKRVAYVLDPGEIFKLLREYIEQKSPGKVAHIEYELESAHNVQAKIVMIEEELK